MIEYEFQLFDRRTLRGKGWFFRFVAPNGEKMAQSEAYNSAEARTDAVATIRAKAGSAAIVQAP